MLPHDYGLSLYECMLALPFLYVLQGPAASTTEFLPPQKSSRFLWPEMICGGPSAALSLSWLFSLSLCTLCLTLRLAQSLSLSLSLPPSALSLTLTLWLSVSLSCLSLSPLGSLSPLSLCLLFVFSFVSLCLFSLLSVLSLSCLSLSLSLNQISITAGWISFINNTFPPLLILVMRVAWLFLPLLAPALCTPR